VQVNHRGNWVIARVKASSGLSGLGDASHGGRDAEVISRMRAFFERLRGRSIFDVEPFRRDCWAGAAQARRVDAVAFSALEQALYDLQGKALGLPCWALFGGRIHSRIRHYANINRATTDRQPEGFAGYAGQAVRAGFDAIKMASFDGMPRRGDAEIAAFTDQGVQCIAAVRKVIGPNRDLLVDAHSNFDLQRGLELAERLEPYRLFWLEEVCRATEDLARLNQAAAMPTAGGESIFGVRGFFPYIAAGAVDITMPDVKYCGGMLELKKIAAMSEAAGMPCSPHGPASPVGNVAAAHVCATMPNFLILELGFGEVPWRSELVWPPESFERGQMAIPDTPGLGITLNEPLARRQAV